MFSHRQKNAPVKWELHTDTHSLPIKVRKYFLLIENIHLVPTGIRIAVIGRMCQDKVGSLFLFCRFENYLCIWKTPKISVS